MDRLIRTVHAVVPAGIDDPARPSGGNRYDRRVLDALAGRGRQVHEQPVAGDWPEPSPADRSVLDRMLGAIPAGSPVLIDGLIASSAAAEVAAHTGRLRVVVLLHMPLGTAAERALLSRCAAVVTSSRWVGARLRGDLAPDGALDGPGAADGADPGAADGADPGAGVGAGNGLDPDRVIVAEPGVDPADPVTPAPGGGRLLAVAVLAPHKGHDVLIAALHRLADLPWTCTIAGSAAIDPAYAGRLRTAAAGLGQRVRFVGPLTGPELDRAYAAADLLVHPSRSETYGMVLTEALSRAIPVVASDVGGVPGAVGRDALGRRPGRLIAPDDELGLADALRTWLTDPNCRAQWRDAAGGRRRTLTGWSATADLVEQALVPAEVAPGAPSGAYRAGAHGSGADGAGADGVGADGAVGSAGERAGTR